MLSLFKHKKFFSDDEEAKIVEAIRAAEKQTSGEVRVYVESKNRFVDPLDRAAEIFYQLKMFETDHRNAVLIYLATIHREMAIFADEGIFKKAGQQFWNEAAHSMISEFRRDNFANGLTEIIFKTGELLKTHFPYNSGTDKNELPDNIVFGK